MHRAAIEAVYAFRAQDGTWFGPHDALPAGGFTDGMLRFEPAQTVNALADQVLTMRFGSWDHDVSVHACQVTLPDGTPRRVRVTHAVLDLLTHLWPYLVLGVCRVTHTRRRQRPRADRANGARRSTAA